MSFLRPKLVILVLVTITLTLGASLCIYGQGGVGQIVGTVTDPSGAVVAGASITARETSTGVVSELKTNSDGVYRFTDLTIGQYTLAVSAPGFKTLEQTGVRVISGTVLTLDLKLDLGQTSQTVQVSAAAVAVATTTSQVGTTRTTEELTDLPLLVVGAARNAVSLLRTLPGVDVTPGLYGDDVHGMDRWPYGGVTTATVNGGIQGGASYIVDGVYSSAGSAEQLRDDFAPPPEMVEEIRLNATNTPEYGWNGGISVTEVIKSGTNQVHGSVYEFLRNTSLDARNHQAASVSDEKQNEWGFVVGGPVYLPHVYDGRNKTFFFAQYGGYRYRTAPGGDTYSVPTAAMRQGDFSSLLGPLIGNDALGRPMYTNELYDPNTTRPGPGSGYVRDPFMFNGAMNVIDPSRISKVTSVFQAGYPAPNLPGNIYNYAAPLHESYIDSAKYSFKIDENLGQNQRLTFSDEQYQGTNFAGGKGYAPIIAGDSESLFTTYHYRLIYTAILRSNLVYSFRAGLNRMIEDDTVPPAELNGAAVAGLTGLGSNATPYIYLGPCCGTNGYFGVGAPIRGVEKSPLWTIPISTDLSWQKGNHSFKFGGQYMNNNEYYLSPVAGSTFSFLNLETAMPGTPLTGWNYASYWLGSVDGVNISGPSGLRYEDAVWGFYGMDSWRVTHKLTVNYGFRWDIYLQPHESHDQISSISLTEPNPGAGGLPGAEQFWGVGAGRNGLHTLGNAYLGGVGPSLGFAYALNPKTVIRGSYGLAYPNTESALITLPILSSLGFSASRSRQSLNNGITPYLGNWDAGVPGGFLPPVPSLDPTISNGGGDLWFNTHNLKAARVQNISFGVEREIPAGIIVKASYVGTMSHGSTWLGSNDYDQLNPKYLSLGNVLNEPYNSPDAVAAGITSPYAGFSGLAWQALLPYPQFTSIGAVEPNGWSTYNALQATVQKRASHGLTMLLSYTYSKELTTNTGSSFDPNQDIGIVTNPFVTKNYNAQKLKILAEDDRPQNLNLSWVYELPFGPGQRFANSKNPISRQVVGGWRISVNQSYVSGTPPVVFGASNLPSSLTQWAVQNPGVPVRTGVSCGNFDPNGTTNNHYLNSAAFSNAAPFTFGDVSTLPAPKGCGFTGKSIAAQKIFTLTERAHLTFSADINNVFNRHSWMGPFYNSTGDPADFGVFRVASTPRLIQLHMKIDW